MTLRVSKERKKVTIYTRNHRIEGEMYLASEARVTDELNVRNREFIAVTNAKIYSLHGDNFIQSVDYVTINKGAIDVVLFAGYSEG